MAPLLYTVNTRLVAHAQLEKRVKVKMSARGYEVYARGSEVNNSKLAANKKFRIHRKLVQTWCKQENGLLDSSSSRRRLPGRGK